MFLLETSACTLHDNVFCVSLYYSNVVVTGGMYLFAFFLFSQPAT